MSIEIWTQSLYSEVFKPRLSRRTTLPCLTVQLTARRLQHYSLRVPIKLSRGAFEGVLPQAEISRIPTAGSPSSAVNMRTHSSYLVSLRSRRPRRTDPLRVQYQSVADLPGAIDQHQNAAEQYQKVRDLAQVGEPQSPMTDTAARLDAAR